MPRNGKEGILFNFVMSALMIYIMAALNMYVHAALGLGGLALDAPWHPWWHVVINFPLAFVVGMICDLGFCTPHTQPYARIRKSMPTLRRSKKQPPCPMMGGEAARVSVKAGRAAR